MRKREKWVWAIFIITAILALILLLIKPGGNEFL